MRRRMFFGEFRWVSVCTLTWLLLGKCWGAVLEVFSSNYVLGLIDLLIDLLLCFRGDCNFHFVEYVFDGLNLLFGYRDLVGLIELVLDEGRCTRKDGRIALMS